MHPVLFSLGPITIHTYGFFLAIGFMAGMAVAVKEAKRLGLNHEIIVDLCFYALVAAIIFSRAPYVLFNWSIFKDNPLEMFYLWKGGLVFYGGFLGASAVFIYFIKKNRLPFLKIADIAALCVPLGHFFGRLGCFSTGRCYGKQCSLPWAVKFSNPHSLAPTGVSLHPTQLYSAAGNLSIFLFLYFVLRKRKKHDGEILAAYLFLYAVFRFTVEFFRADDRGSFFLSMSPSQNVAVVLALTGIALYIYISRKKSS